MIRLSVLCPTTDGASFDHDYYRDEHVPLALKTWGLDGAQIDKGINGPYVAASTSPSTRRTPCKRRWGRPVPPT